MTLNDLLEDYDQLTTDCRELLEDELSRLRSGQEEPEAAFVERKQALIRQLDHRLDSLKALRNELEEAPYGSKSRLDFLQQKFMQILKLDREIEKTLLTSGRRNEVDGAAMNHARITNAYRQR